MFLKKMDSREDSAPRKTKLAPFSYTGTLKFETLDAFDPKWQENFGDALREKGLDDTFIYKNQEFIVEFLKEEQAKARS